MQEWTLKAEKERSSVQVEEKQQTFNLCSLFLIQENVVLFGIIADVRSLPSFSAPGEWEILVPMNICY